MWKRKLVLVGILVAGTASAEEMRTAANGASLPVPEIAGLSCVDMEAVLDRFTESGYRGLDPVPQGHADRPLYDYEDALAVAYYDRCQSGTVHFGDTSETFGLGFN